MYILPTIVFIDSTQFWILTVIIFGCSLFCLCFTVFTLSWKEQHEDHGGDTLNIREYFNQLWVIVKLTVDEC